MWQWNHNPDDAHWSLTDRPGYLRLTTGRLDDGLLSARNTLTQRTVGPECVAAVALDVSGMKDGDVAGLCLLQKNYGFVGVTCDADQKHIVMHNGAAREPVEVERVPLTQNALYLRAACDFRDRADKARFYYSLDGESWKPVGNELKMSYTLPHFMGYRFGLFNYATKETGGHADFDYFRISDRGLDSAATAAANTAPADTRSPGSNPIIRDVFTADPAPLVVGDTLYLYVGRDDAKEGEMFTMPEWLCFSTKDMKSWTAHGPVLSPADFEWGEANSAWASQVVERDGKFYYFVTARGEGEFGGNNIGVAIADSPTGPFKDAIGKPLVQNSTTPDGRRPWEDIDPTVWIDDDGAPWMSWGNGDCYLVRLKPNMIELDGEIQKIDLPHYVEGPWLYKRDDLYYLVYAAIKRPVGSEQIAYATAEKIDGPWEFRGFVTGPAENSFTIHPGIVEFKGHSYFFYHHAGLTIDGVPGALGRRAVCVERLEYDADGAIKPITQTAAGVSAAP